MMPLTLKTEVTTSAEPLAAELQVQVFEDSHGGDDVNLTYQVNGEEVDFAYMAGWDERTGAIPTDHVLANAQRLRECWNACIGIADPMVMRRAAEALAALHHREPGLSTVWDFAARAGADAAKAMAQ